MSPALVAAIGRYRETHKLHGYQVAGRAGINKSLLSALIHGKVVNKGDPRLAAVGRLVGLPPEEWEEPA